MAGRQSLPSRRGLRARLRTMPRVAMATSVPAESAFRAAEMASADLPLSRIGPLYEAIKGRFARQSRGAYAEAASRFPRSPFWREMASPRERLGPHTM
jgi:hypothetical protein